ncbi:Rx, N-terminal [Dillenia turbinata]|uniref:Rx, N-terminal n=1 Tax=Dillenia turbinata TaxID=194707 RepID=A0AAN8ZD84_9MAGN
MSAWLFEEKQVTCPSVKLWLNELRDLAYDVEDMLVEHLEIVDCEVFEALPEDTLACKSDSKASPLEWLRIHNCPSFTHCPKTEIPILIKCLSLSCVNLQALPDGIMTQHGKNNNGIRKCALESLGLYGCLSLNAFPTDELVYVDPSTPRHNPALIGN